MSIIDLSKRNEEAKIYHIKEITERNLNKIRISFSKAFLNQNFRENLKIEEINKFFDELKKEFDTSNELDVFASHQENFEHFLKTGDIKTPLSLKDEKSQLYWGIALGYLAAHPEIQQSWDPKHYFGRMSQSTLWKRIENSSYMQKELKKHAYIIKRSVDNPETKIMWSEMGYPNISYCYDRSENVIIDDMLWTLVCGTDAAATAINHEIAHSQGTQFVETPKMLQIKKEQEDLVKELDEKSKAKDDEGWLKAAKQAERKRIEYQYRFRFLDELENMFANRFSVNFGGNYDKAHLNELETVINLGEKFLTSKTLKEAREELDASAEKRVQHVKDIARNTFFMNNNILNNEKELHSLHLYPELLDGRDEKGVKMGAAEAFDRIKEICLKFEEKQPSFILKESNPGLYALRMSMLSKERCKLVDEFFDMFVAHHMEEIYQKAENKVEQSLQEAKENQQNSQSTQGQGQSREQSQNEQNQSQGQGQGQGQSGEQSQNEQNQSQGQGQGQSQNEQGEGQDQSSQGQGQSGEQSQSEQRDGQGQSQTQGNDGNSQSQGSSSQGSDGNSQGQSQGQGQNGQSQERGSSSSPNSSSIDPNNIDENGYPSSEQFKIEQNKKPGEGELTSEQKKQVGDKASNVDELAKEAEETLSKEELPERENENNKKQRSEKTTGRTMSLEEYLAESEQNKMTASNIGKPSYGGSSVGRELYKGTYDKYMERIDPFAEDIAKVRLLIEKLITQKKLDSLKQGKQQIKKVKTLTPEQGASTLDVRAHINLMKKMRTGDPSLNIDDFNRFKSKRKYSKDELIEKVELQESNIVILLDDSGSMYGAPFQSALNTACILYEASRKIKEVNVFVYAMGDSYHSDALPIAIPGMTTKQIAENLDSIGSSGCNDSIFPALEMGLKDVTDHMAKKPSDICGFTHIFALTDGYNGDYTYRDGDKCLEILLNGNPQLTIDFFFTGTNDNNYMRSFLNKKKAEGSTQIDSVEGIFADNKPLGEKISEILLKRMQVSKVKEPQTNELKQKLIKDSVQQMSKVERTGHFY